MIDQFDEDAESKGKTSALSDETAKARRALIAVTALWAAITFLELTPTHISFLDIDLENARVSPDVLVAVVALYFWASFLIYGFQDGIDWYRGSAVKILGLRNQLTQRIESDAIAQAVLDRALRENLPDTAKVNIPWPGHPQESTILNLKTGLPGWKAQAAPIRRQLNIAVIDVTMRTAWEFLLPLGCGSAVIIWLVCRFK